jgi:hypothetical protein
VIFHSKLPHDLGSGGVRDCEFHTPTAGAVDDEPPDPPGEGATISRPVSNPHAATHSEAAAIIARDRMLRNIVQFLIGCGGNADYKIGRPRSTLYGAAEKIAVFPQENGLPRHRMQEAGQIVA